jgi:hypothetical protein
MALSRAKICRVIADNENVGTEFSGHGTDLMDLLDDAAVTAFAMKEPDECTLLNDTPTYQLAWTTRYTTPVKDAFRSYYNNTITAKITDTTPRVPWEDSDMKKRLDKELKWCPGYADGGKPLAHNVPFLCGSLITLTAQHLCKSPAALVEVSFLFIVLIRSYF